MRQENIIIAAFGLGVVISLFESMCTGQVYLPTVIYVLHDNRLRLNALLYLLVYNVMFIVPLLGVFAAAYAGMRSQVLSRFLAENARLIKLLMSLLFFVIGAVLLLSF